MTSLLPLLLAVPAAATRTPDAAGFEWAARAALLLLPLAVLPWWRLLDGRMRGRVEFSSIGLLAACTGSLWVRLRFLPTLLRSLAILLLVACLARPGKADEQTRVFVEGIAIELVVDRSGSMRALDFTIGGRSVDRLTAVKRVVEEFVAGGDGLPGRPSDLIGLVAFARHADTLCPLTLDHQHLLAALAAVRMPDEPSEDGTAIGDALAMSVERMRDLEDRREIKSRIVILLTDGESNAGAIEPLMAAEIARAYGVKVYTIGVGTRGFAKVPYQVMGRTILRDEPVSIDEETLRQVAAVTGGEYFRATDTDSLRRIYETIDSLERTRTEQRRYRQFRDFATEPFRLGGVALPPLLLLPLLLLAGDLLLSATRLRSVP
jgi:Ca-activated chloride channel family protein